MSNVLCMYYSRTGNTKKAMEEVAQALGAELVELRDDVPRDGWKGWLRCGMDAMRKSTAPLCPYETAKPLESYRLVILGTPVWAGRCSAVVRAFLKEHGAQLKDVAYVITRGGNNKSEEVFEQMDHYISGQRQAAVSLRSDSVGYRFWMDEFLRKVQEFLSEQA